MSSNYKKLANYIQPVNRRNTDLKVEILLGVSIQKILMPSIANTVGTNMKTYKIIEKNQFAYGPVTSRNGDKISIALLQEFDEAIISQAYTVFEVVDTKKLHPEYLMMWFRRPEFDRYARFKSHGSARETFDWDELCEVELPIPSIEKQREIVKEYNTVTNRIKLNEQLNQKLEETAQALYKHWFVDFEFPNKEGRPYKSYGGEMVYNEELDKEIPKGWSVEKLTDVLKIFGGGTPKTTVSNYWNGQIPFFTPKDLGSSYYSIETEKSITKEGLKSCSSKLYPVNTIFITARGTVGAINLAGKEMAMNQSCYAFQEVNFSNYYGHQLAVCSMNELTEEATGAVFKALVTKDFEGKRILCPENDTREIFDKMISPLYANILSNTEQSRTMKELQSLLLAKMTKVEQENEVEI